MAERSEDGVEERDPGLGEVDPELNIFALANGLDLHREVPGPGDRTLEWYRDGMDRRIHLSARPDGSVAVHASASRRRDGVPHSARRAVGEPIPAERLGEELRGRLARGIEVANALTRDELEPDAGPPSASA